MIFRTDYSCGCHPTVATFSYFRQPFVQDFPFLASVLRLSCKYFICIPRKQCLERLQTYFPATLADWDRREYMSIMPDGHYEPRHEIPSSIHVINLARELNVGSILPAAFYDLARYGTSKTAGGTEPLAHLVLEVPSNDNSPMSATCTSAPPSSFLLALTFTCTSFSFRHLHLPQRRTTYYHHHHHRHPRVSRIQCSFRTRRPSYSLTTI